MHLKKHNALCLAVILMLGFTLRWIQLDWGQSFGFNMQEDGVISCIVARDYANGDQIAQYIGQPNYNDHSKLPGPLWTLFCLSGLNLTGTPDGIMYELLALNTLTIYLAYLLAERTCGSGLLTALLVATAPRIISFSVAVYNPNVMPFFGTLYYLALWRVIQNDNSRSSFWIPFIPLLALQFHMSGLLLVPVGILLIIISAARLNYMWLVLGGLAGIGIYLPYIRGEAANQWQNTMGMLRGGGWHVSVEALKIFSSTAGFLVNWSAGWVRTSSEYTAFGKACFGSQYVLFGIYAISTVVAAFLLYCTIDRGKNVLCGFKWSSRKNFFRNSGMAFLSMVVLLSFIFALLEGKAYHARYCLVFIIPVFALVGAAVLPWLLTSTKRHFFVVILAISIALNIWITIETNIYQERNIEFGSFFIPSFRKLESVYIQLKNNSGWSTPIRIDDTSYYASLPKGDRFLRDALLVKLFVGFREKGQIYTPQTAPAPLTYVLSRSDTVRRNDPRVAYYGNGIALEKNQ